MRKTRQGIRTAIAIGSFVLLGAAPVLAEASLEISDSFEDGFSNWAPHLYASPTDKLVVSSDPKRPAPVWAPMNLDTSPGGISGNFLSAQTFTAPASECIATNCPGDPPASCPWPDLSATVSYGLVNTSATYDPALDGTLDRIEVSAYLKTWPNENSRAHKIDQRIRVLIRQSDGATPMGYRFFTSEASYAYVFWENNPPDDYDGVWTVDPDTDTPVSLSINDLDAFYEVFADATVDSDQSPDWDSPFEIGLAFIKTGTHGEHLGCNTTEDSHLFAFPVNIGVDNFVATLFALDNDDDGVAENLDFCSVDPQAPSPCGLDTDNDGYGNRCDGDFNNDGAVDFNDTAYFQAALASGVDSGTGTDMNCDGSVDFNDIHLFQAQLGSSVPGPSGLSCAGTVPCP